MDPDLDYLVIARRHDDPRAEAVTKRLRDRLSRTMPQLLVAHETPELLVLLDPRRVRIARDATSTTLLIGTAFDRSGSPVTDTILESTIGGHRDTAGRACAIVEGLWGRYLALFLPSFGILGLALLRDPLGAMPAYRIARDGVTVIAGSVARDIARALGVNVVADMDQVGRALAHPPLVTFRSLLREVELLPAGTLTLLGPSQPVTLWHPERFAAEPIDADRATHVMRASVDLCCRAWVSLYRDVLVELSGGLDSAILLGALGGDDIAVRAINFTTGHIEGDERAHARAAATLHSVSLTERHADAERMDYRQLLEDIPTAAPRLYGLDPQHERMIANEAMTSGARAIFTGQGGDALFFQMPTPLIAVDHARAFPGRAALAMAMTSARRANCSVWRILHLMLRDRRGRATTSPESYDRALLSQDLLESLDWSQLHHPWLDRIEHLPPAKRLQIEGLANCQLFFAPTQRGRVAALVHPLLSQPLVEACLAIPTFILAPDERDRGLARDAFADRLPPSIRTRRGKGEASAYYNRALVANLPLLRDYLLDGELVRAGLLDRSALEMVLDEDHLLWADQARPPLLYASVEAWVRQWRT